ncbi:MAG: diaminopimelate epimerase [Candidatus Cloacimonetes bacterium]|nr:diaminopimelate epimerase [Candidatus Cloacimonadota bacterium]MBT6994820.1 diaminopimelate epimerase [Candidatus Cloacimonadota bacterium]MBT7470192.1 diaminopimelate epimerase [Candidatus Cloacimonadota bacterium]
MFFVKMQAQGNDYLYFNFLENELPKIDFSELAKNICNRKLGVGADGIVMICKDLQHDALMRIFNANGSEAEMCGSALRCVTHILAKKKGQNKIFVNTKSGVKIGEVLKNLQIKVNMGVPKFIDENVNVLNFGGQVVSVGNPHFVTFVENLEPNFAQNFGAKIEAKFTHGINVQFVKIVSKNKVKIQIWERGSGVTLACGTGAIAAVFAAKKQLSNLVEVEMPGGIVKVEFKGEEMFLIGEVNCVFEGKWNLEK